MIVICLKKKEPTVRQLRRKAQKYLKNIGYKTKRALKNTTKSSFIFLKIVKDTTPEETLKQKILWLSIPSLKERGIKETVDTEITEQLKNINIEHMIEYKVLREMFPF